jgi:hypothetical protein
MVKMQEFKIFGTVSSGDNSRGKKLNGLIVEPLNAGLQLFDRLGRAVTNEEGYFEIIYPEKDFSELFFDKKPDIYLRVKTKEGRVLYTSEEKILYGPAQTEYLRIVIPDELFYEVIESERAQFRKLVDLNPNYFGNITDETLKDKYKPVFKLLKSIKYEELKCVGLLPEKDLLEAVLEIKLPYGYHGGLCSTGSKEFVSFFIDYGDGAGYENLGAPAEVSVHNLASASQNVIQYAVKKPFMPKTLKWCKSPQIVKVKAILSWNKIPTGPDFVPVWGNIVEVNVQLRHKKWYIIQHLQLNQSELLQNQADLLHEIYSDDPAPKPYPLVETITYQGNKKDFSEILANSVKAEEAMLKDRNIEKERSGFKQLMAKNPNYFGGISENKDKNELFEDIVKLPSVTLEELFPQWGIDFGDLIPVKPLFYNINFEELTCLGLYPEEDILEAVIKIKKPTGYSGNLCTLGSCEYVAFYIDWGTGTGFEYVATTNVNVYDIPEAAEKQLHFAVKVVIPNIQARLKDCSVENVVKVKAILSWNYDPTPLGHTFKPTWGNVLVRNIQVRPKNGVKCNFNVVNFIHIDDIDKFGTTAGQAIKVNSGGVTVPYEFDRPFGGVIAVWGTVVGVEQAKYYRFSYRDDLGSSWINITQKRRRRLSNGATGYRTPDPNGWLSIQDYKDDLDLYPLQALIHWGSFGLNGLYHLKLELADSGKNFLPGQAFETPIFLDNTGVALKSFGGTDLNYPASGVVVKDDTNHFRKCSTFSKKENIRVFGNFTDDYFLDYSLVLFGGNLPASGISVQSLIRYDSGATGIGSTGIIGAINNGPGKEMVSLNLCDTIKPDSLHVKCAYGFQLHVRDRSLVGGLSGYSFNTTHHAINAFTTFNWDPQGC